MKCFLLLKVLFHSLYSIWVEVSVDQLLTDISVGFAPSVMHSSMRLILFHLHLTGALVSDNQRTIRLLFGLLKGALGHCVAHGGAVSLGLVVTALLEDLLVAFDLVLVEG